MRFFASTTCLANRDITGWMDIHTSTLGVEYDVAFVSLNELWQDLEAQPGQLMALNFHAALKSVCW